MAAILDGFEDIYALLPRASDWPVSDPEGTIGIEANPRE
jgi:hypothetical protein